MASSGIRKIFGMVIYHEKIGVNKMCEKRKNGAECIPEVQKYKL